MKYTECDTIMDNYNPVPPPLPRRVPPVRNIYAEPFETNTNTSRWVIERNQPLRMFQTRLNNRYSQTLHVNSITVKAITKSRKWCYEMELFSRLSQVLSSGELLPLPLMLFLLFVDSIRNIASLRVTSNLLNSQRIQESTFK